MHHLDAARDLSAARDLPSIAVVVRTVARAMTGAQGVTFVLREDGNCFYADEDAIAPLWKGQRFPLSTCISGWAMLNDATAVIPDITLDPRIPQAAYRPTFVRSLAMVPVGSPLPVAAIGAYWSRARRPPAAAVAALQQIAALTATAMNRIDLTTAPWAPNFALHPTPAD
ncbi:GAF domain-containing protein [Kribbella sp. NPDC051587]|uniref:GAF domain-containing protein n=1 Tax=Kribbella sp. NPDC051587 TaxID=3364119 RepID=UPI0037A6444D